MRSLCGRAPESVSRLYGHRHPSLPIPDRTIRDETMLDLVFIALGAALFLGALIYARGCAEV